MYFRFNDTPDRGLDKLRNNLSSVDISADEDLEKVILSNPLIEEDGSIEKTDTIKKNLFDSPYPKVEIANWLPVKDIQYGIIITKDNRYVKILELNAVNFFHMPIDEQNSILDSFTAWFRVSPYKFSFKSMSTEADPSIIISNVLKNTVNEADTRVLECRDDYIDLLKSNSTGNTFTKRFFFIFEYEQTNGLKTNDMEQIFQSMNETASRFVATFNSMGNEVIIPENDTFAQAEILYTMLNRKTCFKESFQERVDRVTQDTLAMYNTKDISNVDLPLTRYIGQRGYYPNYKNYLVSDGIFYTFMYIDGNGYPGGKQLGGWTKMFTDLGEGVDTDIYYTRKDRLTTIQDVKRRLRWKYVDVNEQNNSGQIDNVDESYGDFQSIKYILNSMRDNHDDMFDIAILITITANSLSELQKKVRVINDTMKENDVIAVTPNYRMNDAYIMSLPLLQIDKFIFGKARRNMTTSSLAGTYMFASSELFDTTGIVAGLSSDNTLMAFNPFNTKIFKNANMLLVGTPGSGKTFTEQMFMRRFGYMGVQVIGILPLKAHEYRRGLNHMAGEFIKLVPSSPDCVNILEIRAQDNIDEAMIEGGEYVEDSLVNKKIKQVITFIQLLMKSEKMRNQEAILLEEALTRMYESFGITADNNSIFEDINTRQVKTMPIIGDLYNIIKDIPDLKRIEIQLRPFITGTCRNLNGQTNVNLDNNLILFDIEGAGKDLLPAFMFIALDFAYDVVKSNRTKNNMILLDEVWKMMLNPMAAEFVLELVKIVRGYGGGTMIATQDINDFLGYHDGMYGKGIIAATKIKICLQLEDGEVDRVADLFKLSDAERKSITKFERGTGMFLANKDKMFIHFNASKMESEDFTTDPNQLKRIKEERAALFKMGRQ